MAKKIAPASEKQTAGKPNKQLLDAIVAVKRLQAFIEGHGGWGKALDEVAKVRELTELTGGFDSLKQALEAVGKDTAAPEE